jgi:hypothetical protein
MILAYDVEQIISAVRNLQPKGIKLRVTRYLTLPIQSRGQTCSSSAMIAAKQTTAPRYYAVLGTTSCGQISANGMPSPSCQEELKPYSTSRPILAWSPGESREKELTRRRIERLESFGHRRKDQAGFLGFPKYSYSSPQGRGSTDFLMPYRSRGIYMRSLHRPSTTLSLRK